MRKHAHNGQYASPEIARNEEYNRKSDIFSLGCVFAEMLAVYKGCSYEDFREFRPGHYHTRIPETLRKLESIADVKQCDVQLLNLIRSMLDEVMSKRPNADTVWKRATTCTSSSVTGADIYFCGPCCMPFPLDAGLREPYQKLDLTTMPYHTNLPHADRAPFGKDPNFETWHGTDELPGFEWVRNLRHGCYSLHDVVKCASERAQLGRKMVIRVPNPTTDVTTMVQREAELIRELAHQHIVKLKGTYRQGTIYGLLFQPAADYDLRT